MLRLARIHPRHLHPALTRASHVGSSPIPIPPDLSLSLTHDSAVHISGPRGQTSVSLPAFVKLSLSPYVPSPNTSASSPYQTSSSGLSKPGAPPSVPPTQVLEVSVEDPEQKEQRAAWGLTRALVANAVTGISRGFTVELNLVGVGYRMMLEKDPATGGERLGFKLGFAHWIYVPIPPGITAQVPQPTRVVLGSNDKHQLGQFAAEIRAFRKPEPYKGKGIFVGDETIKLKDVKKK
ncbi:50S ribosomal protein L6 [Ochrobactrum anthropi ATCC 49188] [Rhizoctonia solani]|uniref:50S ribosomal protein L6 [Ochrobactrum anthropi ATCC 49188] n=1 Tax=Rhizoctonia solani TaxID=456999 RepID=A0A0K6FQE4_9AGAM|nr:50S ribosomal protein L6 [Ochrobactrum anthropi ATCC 49188] [Rhizoctonia solani]